MIVDDDNDIKKPPIKDKPRPRRLDSKTVKWLKKNCDFKPFDVEW